MTDSGDTYKRVYVADGVYQCGCHWADQMYLGSVLIECSIHRQATEAKVKSFERDCQQLTDKE